MYNSIYIYVYIRSAVSTGITFPLWLLRLNNVKKTIKK